MRTVRGLLVLLILTAATGLGRAADLPPAEAGDVSVPAAGPERAAATGVAGAAPMVPESALPDSGKAESGPVASDSGRVVVPPAAAGSARMASPPTALDLDRQAQRRVDPPDSSGTGAAASNRPWLRRPRQIMLRSVAVPGWGQWANGRHVKAAVVAAGEGYLLWRAADYGRQERVRFRQARDTVDPAAKERLEQKHRALGAHRRDFTWWSVFAALLSMGDAYVDAQLGDFDAEFQPQGTEAWGGSDPGWRAVVSLRW